MKTTKETKPEVAFCCAEALNGARFVVADASIGIIVWHGGRELCYYNNNFQLVESLLVDSWVGSGTPILMREWMFELKNLI